MKLDHESVQKVASMVFWSAANEAFGEEGKSYVNRLLNGVREFFKAIPPDQFGASFVFAYPVVAHENWEMGVTITRIATSLSVDDLPAYRRRIEDTSAVFITVRPDGCFDLATSNATPSHDQLSKRSLIFLNEDGIDQFIIGGHSEMMPKLVTGIRSNFAVPTVVSLEEALESYRRDAANVSCYILEKIWVGGRNGPRLVFENKPESTMRRSLERFLSTKLEGDVTVRAEHNTDETKPVDLSINWFGSRLRALIEIKWLGDSLNSDGTRLTSFRDARAQEGADQLVDYMDREVATDPNATLRGYLAVFDGRRRGIIDAVTPISAEDACYYRGREIVLTRDWAAERIDVAPLVRYFLEPRESMFARPEENT